MVHTGHSNWTSNERCHLANKINVIYENFLYNNIINHLFARKNGHLFLIIYRNNIAVKIVIYFSFQNEIFFLHLTQLTHHHNADILV